MKTAYIDSHLRCPRCTKRLVVDIGAGEDRGEISVIHRCLSCPYSESAPRTVAEAHRRSDVPQLQSLRESLRQQRLEGVVVPLRVDTEPWSKEEWNAPNLG